MLSKVVLPAPLAPMMADTRPALKIPLIFLRITLSSIFLFQGTFMYFFLFFWILTAYDMF